jgi:hypothetical protein
VHGFIDVLLLTELNKRLVDIAIDDIVGANLKRKWRAVFCSGVYNSVLLASCYQRLWCGAFRFKILADSPRFVAKIRGC